MLIQGIAPKAGRKRSLYPSKTDEAAVHPAFVRANNLSLSPHNRAKFHSKGDDRMDRHQLPPTAQPDIPAQVSEIRVAERSDGHERRNAREVVG